MVMEQVHSRVQDKEAEDKGWEGDKDAAAPDGVLAVFAYALHAEKKSLMKQVSPVRYLLVLNAEKRW